MDKITQIQEPSIVEQEYQDDELNENNVNEWATTKENAVFKKKVQVEE